MQQVAVRVRGGLGRQQITTWAATVQYVERSLSRIEQELAEAQAPSLSIYDVLYAVYSSKEQPVRFGNLHKGTILSKSALSRSVASLIRSGQIEGSKTETDKRGLLLTITPKGIQSMKQTWRVYGPAIQKYFASKLVTGDLEVLASLVAKLNS